MRKSRLFAAGILALMLVFGLVLAGCDSPPADATYKVLYYGNGNTSGFPPTDNTQYTAGEEATVLL